MTPQSSSVRVWTNRCGNGMEPRERSAQGSGLSTGDRVGHEGINQRVTNASRVATRQAAEPNLFTVASQWFLFSVDDIPSSCRWMDRSDGVMLCCGWPHGSMHSLTSHNSHAL
ncbi:hypothetical protein Pmani_030454 [Petrolisthes manimaculis]|uniref:Uncharacterized protein n=1 Tax=Petrolisthes manimaculis TaxID=1843537 RepID=A0AAE1TTF5_9EUCA|nr:hypothetical protein Pmani_030454 [Petrolisthes manimaculis]